MNNKYGKNNTSVEIKDFGIDAQIQVTPNREATFIISAEKRDDDGEVVKIDGMDISAVETGARDVAWANHDYNQPAAKIKSIRKIGKTLIAEVEYPTRPSELPITESWHPDVVYAYAKAGLMKASIDFMSTERREASKKDLLEYGDDTSTVHSKSKLLGFSFTSAPANDGCQMLAIKCLKDGVITSTELELMGIKEVELVEEIKEVEVKEVEKPKEEDEKEEDEGEEKKPKKKKEEDDEDRTNEGEGEETEEGASGDTGGDKDGEEEEGSPKEEDEEDDDEKKKALTEECNNILETIRAKKFMYISDRKSVQKQVDDEVSRQLGQLKGKLWIE